MSTNIRHDRLFNRVSDGNSSASTISNDANKFTTQRPNVDFGGRMTAGQTLAAGTRRTPHRPWVVFLDVGGAAD